MKYELWYVRVFNSNKMTGNLTPVVVSKTIIPKETCQTLAKQLAMSDSAFISLSKQPTPLLTSFSPYEELNFCTQTLLAAASIMSIKTNKFNHQFRTLNGLVEVKKGTENIWWVSAALPLANHVNEPISLLKILKIPEIDLAGSLCVTGIGRQRIYIPIKSSERLNNLDLKPEQVMQFCKKKNLTGICFFTMNGKNKINLRVFTTSLGGDEDPATGGAALGLLSYKKLFNLQWNKEIIIKQGNKNSKQRGQLFLRQENQEQYGELGGVVTVLSSGIISCPDYQLNKNLDIKLNSFFSHYQDALNNSENDNLAQDRCTWQASL